MKYSISNTSVNSFSQFFIAFDPCYEIVILNFPLEHELRIFNRFFEIRSAYEAL